MIKILRPAVRKADLLFSSIVQKAFVRIGRTFLTRQDAHVRSARLTYCIMSGSDEVQSNVLDNDSWIKQWDDRDIGFHQDFVHPYDQSVHQFYIQDMDEASKTKHLSTLLNGRSNIKIFVPLCGKSLDMKWLSDQGHTVIGVEVAQRAIEEFFEEQSVTFNKVPAPAVDGTLFQSEDQKLQIYCCDFYKMSKDVIGQVDAIWDRGSMVAINVCDRARYAAILTSLMAPTCRYLLTTMEYDNTKYAGPPHHLGEESVREIFEGDNSVQLIDARDVFEERQLWGLDSLVEKFFLIVPKH